MGDGLQGVCIYFEWAMLLSKSVCMDFDCASATSINIMNNEEWYISNYAHGPRIFNYMYTIPIHIIINLAWEKH